MARNITASDRRSLIRLASTMPVGSPERKTLLAAMGDTWFRRLNELKQDYMREVVDEAIITIRTEGGARSGEDTKVKGDVRGVGGEVKGTFKGEPLKLKYYWDDNKTIISELTIGRDSRKHKMVVLSSNPASVAADSLYAHIGGLIP